MRAILLVGLVGTAGACVASTGGNSGSSGTGGTTAVSSSGSAGGATSGGSATTGGVSPVVIHGQIPGEDFSARSVLSLDNQAQPGVDTLVVLISDLSDNCAVLGSASGKPSRTLTIALAVPLPDGGLAVPTAADNFTVVDETGSTPPPSGPLAEITFQDQLDGGCVGWVCTGGSLQLTALDPVQGSFNVTLEATTGESSDQVSLSGSFTATVCPSANLGKLSCSNN